MAAHNSLPPASCRRRHQVLLNIGAAFIFRRLRCERQFSRHDVIAVIDCHYYTYHQQPDASSSLPLAINVSPLSRCLRLTCRHAPPFATFVCLHTTPFLSYFAIAQNDYSQREHSHTFTPPHWLHARHNTPCRTGHLSLFIDTVAVARACLISIVIYHGTGGYFITALFTVLLQAS